MSGTRYARTVVARALTVACVVLLCLFGAGPAAIPAATASESRPASSAPADPAEAPADPAADSESRAALREPARGGPTVRRLPPRMFHVKHADEIDGVDEGARPTVGGLSLPVRSRHAVRSVVLRC
ncbi:hypothetical protein AB0P15_07605 [Streptomyces sp. NPDC087917]|uniref:hypothetical protein n=1 Tax=Streptomyces sp. NPDC087917 TaxID=3155060 RepID=UPI00343FBCDF